MTLFNKILIGTPLALALLSSSALAKNNVSEIDISVMVQNDGSAYVVQRWSGEFNEGTENYIPISTQDIGISDLRVSDENGEYTYIDNWNIDSSFEEKSKKCGINKTDDGVELCFGISEYGENSYSIEYTVTDFIKGYTDFDGTNFMFVNPNMSIFPTNGNINIVLENGMALNEENSGIWSFGYNGYIEFQNGAVRAWTTQALDNDNSMIVMLRLNKGIISPNTSLNKSFEDVMNTAFEGSDYDYDEEAGILETIIGLIILIAIPTLFIMFIAFLIKRKKEIKEFYKQTCYFREAPNKGQIEVSHFLAQNFDVSGEESLIIGALMLSMINKGCIEPLTEENVGMFGKIKQSVNLKLIKDPETIAETTLYSILKVSAGNDGVLQEKELERYAYKNPEIINKMVDSVKSSGEQAFINMGGFVNGSGNCIKDLSNTGKSELSEVMGLKKYLEDFTLIAERGISETIIWKDYLVYATLFGIADKVMEQFKKLYPEKMPELESYNRNVIIANSYYHSMHRSAQRAMQQKRSSGMGGRSSIGGGGGFSGGGSGGGSR
ncbi:MAG: DUF2207 domain-containing protein [Clostridia bacterium]|nr:DUF2207 domain-containing protein [Clostridia bacterium]